MCGLLAIVASSSFDAIPYRKMLDDLRHRGPDAEGWLAYNPDDRSIARSYDGDQDVEFTSGALLGHRRLAIIDLSPMGLQPMSTPDGRYHIVLNGEIYNYLEIREELKDLGIRFRSNSDTEVLLQAWSRWGADCLARLKGMFAFAVLDAEAGRLHLARDFFGIKPLYVATFATGIAAASEIRPLLKLSEVTREIDAESAYTFLTTGLTDCGARTMYKHVSRVPPGHLVEIDVKAARIVRSTAYWSLRYGEPRQLSFQEAVASVRSAFLENIRIHMRSDVPLGVSLSGGIDSSAILCAMRHVAPEAELHAFTFVSSDEQVSELRWARMAAEKARAKLHEVRVSKDYVAKNAAKVLDVQQEPVGSARVFAQYSVFEAAKKAGVKVLLDGQGADELLAGYAPYVGAYVAELGRRGQFRQAFELVLRALSSGGYRLGGLAAAIVDSSADPWTRRVLRRLSRSSFPESLLNWAWFSEHGVTPKRPQKAETLRDALAQSVFESGLQHLLRYEDRNSMAFSIESRVPYLTADFAELIMSLPSSFLIARDGQTKFVFRAAMRGIVPDAILDRREKLGFNAEESLWLDEAKPWVASLLAHETKVPLFRLSPMRAKVVKSLPAAGSRMWVWRILNLLYLCHSGQLHEPAGATKS